MPRFRKKTVEIEAMQFTGRNFREMLGFAGGSVEYQADKFTIETLDLANADLNKEGE